MKTFVVACMALSLMVGCSPKKNRLADERNKEYQRKVNAKNQPQTQTQQTPTTVELKTVDTLPRNNEERISNAPTVEIKPENKPLAPVSSSVINNSRSEESDNDTDTEELVDPAFVTKAPAEPKKEQPKSESPKTEAKEESKVAAKTEEPKEEAKKEEPKAEKAEVKEEKKEEPKVEAKEVKEEPKTEEKKEEAQVADTKEESKAEAPKEEKKAEATANQEDPKYLSTDEFVMFAYVLSQFHNGDMKAAVATEMKDINSTGTALEVSGQQGKLSLKLLTVNKVLMEIKDMNLAPGKIQPISANGMMNLAFCIDESCKWIYTKFNKLEDAGKAPQYQKVGFIKIVNGQYISAELKDMEIYKKEIAAAAEKQKAAESGSAQGPASK